MIKTFRGLLADGGQDRIRLQTIKGKVGYKVKQFVAIGAAPGTIDIESVFKIYKTDQSGAINGLINFTDSDLLGVSYWKEGNSLNETPSNSIIFDNEIFNQDIYVTYEDVAGSSAANYYLELEVIPLDDAGAEYTTLKDLRQV